MKMGTVVALNLSSTQSDGLALPLLDLCELVAFVAALSIQAHKIVNLLVALAVSSPSASPRTKTLSLSFSFSRSNSSLNRRRSGAGRSSETHPILPQDLASDIQQFSESIYAKQYFSKHRTGFIFRRTVPVEQMMIWQKVCSSFPSSFALPLSRNAF